MRWYGVVPVLLLLTSSLFGQLYPLVPGSDVYQWVPCNRDELILWKNHHQVGNLRLDTMTYYPYLGPHRWGAPEDPPLACPKEYKRSVRKTGDWRTTGVSGPHADKDYVIPDSGLHIRETAPAKETPKSRAPNDRSSQIKDYSTERSSLIADAKIPDYSTMPSLTFVASDYAVADQALQSFREAPELKDWCAKYGNRAKAYSADDFAQTSSAFKLHEDQTFAQTGFVALVQAQPPDLNDKAVVRSIYEFSSPAQFAAALRDADPCYNPNRSGPDPALSGWSASMVMAAGGLGLAGFVLLTGIAVVRRRARLI